MTTRLLVALRLLAETIWPQPPTPCQAAITYYESVVEERRAR